jgi:membrane-associated protein
MESILELVRSVPGPLALALVFAGAALEYMVPPLPADSVVLAGALLVLAGTHSLPAVAASAIAGGALGALSHYLLGRACAGPDGQLRGRRWVERMTGRGSLDRFFEVFRRHGLWVLVANRALPGVRAVAFFAAGAAGLPAGRVMLAGLVSNVAWTALLLALGLSVGARWEKIEAAFAVYQRGLAALVVAGLVVYLARRALRRRSPGAVRDAGVEPGEE